VVDIHDIRWTAPAALRRDIYLFHPGLLERAKLPDGGGQSSMRSSF
jgi:hypothetical protein